MPGGTTPPPPCGPLAFQALVALHAAGDVIDGFARFLDQFHPVDAAVARIEEGQIGDVAIGRRGLKGLQGSLALSRGINCSPAATALTQAGALYLSEIMARTRRLFHRALREARRCMAHQK